MTSHASADPALARDPAAATANVVESAIELARAEARLVLTHARNVAIRAVTALLAVLIASSFAQVVLILLALSPLLVATSSLALVLAAFVPSVACTLIGAYVAFRAWKALENTQHKATNRE